MNFRNSACRQWSNLPLKDILKIRVFRCEIYLSYIYLHSLRKKVLWRDRLHNPALKEISTWKRPSSHYTFRTCIPKNQHPKLLNPPLYTQIFPNMSYHSILLSHFLLYTFTSPKHMPNYPWLYLFLISWEIWLILDVLQSAACDLIQLPILCCPAF